MAGWYQGMGRADQILRMVPTEKNISKCRPKIKLTTNSLKAFALRYKKIRLRIMPQHPKIVL